MINILFSRVCILGCGTLYPGYISFKTVRAKNVNDYIKWMMYWIVFAIFTACETFTDIFLAWLPFYYEFKVIFILWLLPTAGNGSSFIYKKCVHPLLKKHEKRFDHQLEEFREKGQYLLLRYIREAALYVVRGIMNAINKNVPNGILGLLTNVNNYANGTSGEVTSNIIIEEEKDQDHVPQTSNIIKSSTKSSKNKNKEPQTSQLLRHRVRTIKLDTETDLVEG